MEVRENVYVGKCFLTTQLATLSLGIAFIHCSIVLLNVVAFEAAVTSMIKLKLKGIWEP